MRKQNFEILFCSLLFCRHISIVCTCRKFGFPFKIFHQIGQIVLLCAVFLSCIRNKKISRVQLNLILTNFGFKGNQIFKINERSNGRNELKNQGCQKI